MFSFLIQATITSEIQKLYACTHDLRSSTGTIAKMIDDISKL